jgi:hypothetical protein
MLSFVVICKQRNFIIVQAREGVKGFPARRFRAARSILKTRGGNIRLCINMTADEDPPI